MDDLIFIATEECLMPQLMKIISACEKTRRSGPVAFSQQISSEREGDQERKVAAPLPQPPDYGC